MVSFNKLQIGKDAEDEACKFLLAKGFSLIQRNYRCHYGEIDLIMQDNEDVVFIEVRSRSRTDYGYAGESINASKKNKLLKTATHFLQAHNWLHKVHSRFDVIAIHFPQTNIELEWIKNAF